MHKHTRITEWLTGKEVQYLRDHPVILAYYGSERVVVPGEAVDMQKKLTNVCDVGTDPSGTHDSTEAFKDALAAHGCGVLVPRGTYLLSGLIAGHTPATEPTTEDAAPEDIEGIEYVADDITGGDSEDSSTA